MGFYMESNQWEFVRVKSCRQQRLIGFQLHQYRDIWGTPPFLFSLGKTKSKRMWLQSMWTLLQAIIMINLITLPIVWQLWFHFEKSNQWEFVRVKSCRRVTTTLEKRFQLQHDFFMVHLHLCLAWGRLEVNVYDFNSVRDQHQHRAKVLWGGRSNEFTLYIITYYYFHTTTSWLDHEFIHALFRSIILRRRLPVTSG